MIYYSNQTMTNVQVQDPTILIPIFGGFGLMLVSLLFLYKKARNKNQLKKKGE